MVSKDVSAFYERVLVLVVAPVFLPVLTKLLPSLGLCSERRAWVLSVAALSTPVRAAAAAAADDLPDGRGALLSYSLEAGHAENPASQPSVVAAAAQSVLCMSCMSNELRHTDVVDFHAAAVAGRGC